MHVSPNAIAVKSSRSMRAQDTSPAPQNVPIAGNLRSATDLRFLSAEELRGRYEKLGVGKAERIVTYCGSGINACQTVFALTLAGFTNARLYEGSWSDWSRDASLPIGK